MGERTEEKPCTSDLEIDYMNKKRNIALELSEEEQLLYTYSQGVTFKLLESMREKFAALQPLAASQPQQDQQNMEVGESGEGMADFPMLSRS